MRLNPNNVNGQYMYEMGFSLDPNNVGNEGFSQIEKGEYEVFPTVYETKKSTTGNDMVTFNYTIRDDVDQEFKGREIRYDNFVFVEAAMWRVNQASKAAGLDMTKEFDSVKEWAEDFKGKAVRVYVDHREHNGKTYPEVKNFKPSQVGGVMPNKGAANDPFANTGELNEDDIPF